MSAPEPSGPAATRPVDAVALARIGRRLNAAAQAPWLHGEVARRMADRLSVIKMQPAALADWRSFVGASRELLAQTYPRARLWAVEPEAPRREATAAEVAPAWWSPRRWTGGAPAAVAPAELGEGQVQLLWSNMGLHAVADPRAELALWHRVLAVDGFLMFSTFGPGTMARLREIYREQGWALPMAPFVDMHDLGDMLVEAGFADPVMDQETLTLTWADPAALLAELHGLGGNAAPQRFAGLRTPRWRKRLLQALAARADAAGRIAMDFEIVYGHAFRPLPRPRVKAQTEVPLEDLRTMARAARRSR